MQKRTVQVDLLLASHSLIKGDETVNDYEGADGDLRCWAIS
jgi:hypothetical protein